MNSASVRFSWTPVNLTVVYHYSTLYITLKWVESVIQSHCQTQSPLEWCQDCREDSSTSSVSLSQSISLESCTLDLLITHYHQKHVCELDIYGRYSITTYFLCVCIIFFPLIIVPMLVTTKKSLLFSNVYLIIIVLLLALICQVILHVLGHHLVY